MFLLDFVGKSIAVGDQKVCIKSVVNFKYKQNNETKNNHFVNIFNHYFHYSISQWKYNNAKRAGK